MAKGRGRKAKGHGKTVSDRPASEASTRKILYIFLGGFFGVFALVGGILGWVFFFAAPLGGPEMEAAVAFARTNPRVRGLVGERIELTKTRGGYVRRSVNAKVDARLTLRGNRGEAEIEVIGFRLGERPWEFTSLSILRDGGDEELLTGE